jgi:hypothetical protein
MLEAVNSVLQTAPLVKANAEQVSTVESFAANPDRIQKAPQVPYLSPYFAVDSDAHVVLQIRDSRTGKVLETYPSNHEEQTRNTTQQSSVRSAGHSSSAHSAGAPAPQQHAQPSSTAGRQIAAFVAASHAGAGASSGSHVSVDA